MYDTPLFRERYIEQCKRGFYQTYKREPADDKELIGHVLASSLIGVGSPVAKPFQEIVAHAYTIVKLFKPEVEDTFVTADVLVYLVYAFTTMMDVAELRKVELAKEKEEQAQNAFDSKKLKELKDTLAKLGFNVKQ